MTVAELITKLQSLPQDYQVVIVIAENDAYVEAKDIHAYDSEVADKTVVISSI